MSRVSWAIVEDASWRIIRFIGNEAETVSTFAAEPDSMPAAVLGEFQRHGYRGEPVLIGLATNSCLAVRENEEESGWDSTSDALRFAIEDRLPIAAEEFEAAIAGRKAPRLAIALPLSPWQAWLSHWEASGLDIRVICPWALLGPLGDKTILSEDGAVRWESTVPCVFEVRGSEVVGWWTIPSCQSTPEMWANWRRCLVCDALAAAGECKPADEFRQFSAQQADELSVRGASLVLAEAARPIVNLRIGRLGPQDLLRPYRSALRRLGMVGAIAMLMIVVLLHRLSQRYETLASNYISAQAVLYRSVFGGSAIPSATRARLASELRRLSIENPSEVNHEELIRAPADVAALLNAIPETLRCRIRSLRVNSGRCELQAEVQSLADAAELQRAISRAGFTVPPAKAELVEGIVPLRLNISRPLPPAAGRGGMP